MKCERCDRTQIDQILPTPDFGREERCEKPEPCLDCSLRLPSSCVVYDGPPLYYSGIVGGETYTEVAIKQEELISKLINSYEKLLLKYNEMQTNK